MVFTGIRGIHRLGDEIVNVYLVEESGSVTIVDAGVPGYLGLIPAALTEMGRSMDDVRAILLTHGHSDHIGFAERARRERSWPVHVHELDAALARGEVPNPAKGSGTPNRLRPLLASCGGPRDTERCVRCILARLRPTAIAPHSTFPDRRGSSTCPATRRGVRRYTSRIAVRSWSEMRLRPTRSQPVSIGRRSRHYGRSRRRARVARAPRGSRRSARFARPRRDLE